MPSAPSNKDRAAAASDKKAGVAATAQKNKKRLRQRIHLKPIPATADAERAFVTVVDRLLAQLAKSEVLKLSKGESHAPEQR